MKTVIRRLEAKTEENRVQFREGFELFATRLICQIPSYLL